MDEEPTVEKAHIQKHGTKSPHYLQWNGNQRTLDSWRNVNGTQ